MYDIPFAVVSRSWRELGLQESTDNENFTKE
jgi:hypothetical protein